MSIRTALTSCSRSWRACATPSEVAPGTCSRTSPASRPTPSRKPTRWPTRSTAATSTICATSWAICAKMIRRHPHVFGDVQYENLDAQKQAWEELKAAERAAKGEEHDASALAGISHGLPEWKRAAKLQQRAATVGFDWPDHRPVLDKLAEEIDEVRAEFDAGADPARLEDEIGDVLFVVANLARHAGVDFSRALRHANAKFERRFRRMEQLAADADGSLAAHDLPAQEALWQRAKRDER